MRDGEILNLYEYMGKEIFRKNGIPVPDGYVIESASQLKPYKKPSVVKSQILLGGRGKSGGIKFAKSDADLKAAASELLGSKIRNLTVTKILIEDMLNIKKELYVSIALSRSDREPVLIASNSGGVEIESVPQNEIFTKKIDPLLVIASTISYVRVPLLEATATSPSLKIWFGIIPILHFPGTVMPGPFGPITVMPFLFAWCTISIVSWKGTCSVSMYTIPIPASIAS